MNCQDFNALLDTRSTDQLSPSERTAIDRHLAECPSCRAEWSDYREMAALAVPAMPENLGARISARLPSASAARKGRAGRAWLIGGVLVAGAAVAATLVLKSGGPGPEPQTSAALESDSAAGELVPLDDAASPATRDEPSVAGSEDAGAVAPTAAGTSSTTDVAATAEVALDPFTIVLLARPDAQATAEFDQCYTAMSRAFGDVTVLNVIAGAAAAAYDGTGLSDADIGRAFGAASVLVVDNANGCAVGLLRSATGARVSGSMQGGPLPSADGFEGYAAGVAMRVRDELLNDPETRLVRARATIVDASASEGERVAALQQLRSGMRPNPDLFDDAIVAAVAQLGMYAADPGVRVSAWASVRGLDDPALVQPLLLSLASDEDESVRMQAALSLNTFIDHPGVSERLLDAIANDPSQVPEVPCCVLTVRDAAERALVPTDELVAWARQRLLDESLSSRDRLIALPFSPDGRLILPDRLGAGAAQAVFAIGASEDDPAVRQMAWQSLAQMPPDAGFRQVLIDDMSGHPDEYVRAAAARVLRQYADDPVVDAALDRALNDPSANVRRAASGLR